MREHPLERATRIPHSLNARQELTFQNAELLRASKAASAASMRTLTNDAGLPMVIAFRPMGVVQEAQDASAEECHRCGQKPSFVTSILEPTTGRFLSDL
jgi:hypothetical protein